MSFDLNISNYKMSELEDMFELPPNYNQSIVMSKEEQVRKKIQGDLKINESVKTNTINFLVKAREVLIKNCSAKNESSLFDKSFKNYFHDTNGNMTKSKVKEEGSGLIIEKPRTGYLDSNSKNVFVGDMNPLLNSTTIKKYLNIDTRFRENYYGSLSTNFGVNLPISINNVVSLKLSAIELPKTFYNISRIFGSNYFTIIRGMSSKQVVVPDGNYDPVSLCKYLSNYMIACGAPFSDIWFTTDINNNSGSGKIVASLIESPLSSDPFTLNFQQDAAGADNKSTPLPLKLGWKMGFRNGVYENNTTYITEGLPDLTGSKYIYLVVDDFNNNVNNGFYSAFTASVMNNNILARISLGGSAFDDVREDESVNAYSRQYFGPVDINKLQIQLLDEYGRILDLNNMDYSFCLAMQVIYDL
jgi:hypothetical protein